MISQRQLLASVAVPLALGLTGCFLCYGHEPIADPQSSGKAALMAQKGTGADKAPTAAESTSLRDIAYQGEVRKDMQYHMLKSMAARKSPEAWGLFSEAGYLDKGQVMIFRKADGGAEVEWVAGGKDQLQGPAAMPSDSFQVFLKIVATAPKLKEYSPPSFDAMRYDYVHVRQDAAGKVELVQRLFMNNPPMTPDSPYQPLIKSFER